MRSEEPSQQTPTRRMASATVVGFVLMVLSGVFFFTMLAVPWFPFSTTAKGVLGGLLFILTQSSWWIGVAMVGPAAIKSFKEKLYRKRESEDG